MIGSLLRRFEGSQKRPDLFSMQSTKSPQVIVWWMLWFSMVSGLVMIYFFVGGAGNKTAAAISYWPVAPLIGSAIVRWMLLPRFKSIPQRFPFFVAGMAMAEACGLLGIFLVPTYSPTFLVLALMGMAQYLPAFAMPKVA